MQFNRLYEAAIDGAERAPLPAKRIQNIIEHMTYVTYLYIQRGLFQRHKLVFAYMLATSILISAKKVCQPGNACDCGAGAYRACLLPYSSAVDVGFSNSFTLPLACIALT